MSTSSNHRPFWACACFKKQLFRGVTALLVIAIGLSVSHALAAEDVARENLIRAFNPTLVNPPTASVGGGASTFRQQDTGAESSVTHHNIARIFDPSMLTRDLHAVSAPAGSEGDVAQQNIDSIFKSPSAL